uniref:Uncharacterized protein n=1 Tax=Strongyloides venezuelensis TaxID=75913 RepID=A0A0K0G673_STRVS
MNIIYLILSFVIFNINVLCKRVTVKTIGIYFGFCDINMCMLKCSEFEAFGACENKLRINIFKFGECECFIHEEN